jgi:hypothetical protein
MRGLKADVVGTLQVALGVDYLTTGGVDAPRMDPRMMCVFADVAKEIDTD